MHQLNQFVDRLSPLHKHFENVLLYKIHVLFLEVPFLIPSKKKQRNQGSFPDSWSTDHNLFTNTQLTCSFFSSKSPRDIYLEHLGYLVLIHFPKETRVLYTVRA